MEGMKFKSFNGEVEMRKTDHQLQQGAVHVAVGQEQAPRYPYDVEEHRLHLCAGEVF